jgi:hypothetical protein
MKETVNIGDYADLLPLFDSGEWAALPPDVGDLLETARRLHTGFQQRARANGVRSGMGPLSALYLAHALAQFTARPAVAQRIDGRRRQLDRRGLP